MAEVNLEDIDREEAVALFGSRDENLRLLREMLGLKVIARGNKVSLQGSQEQVDLGMRFIQQMRAAFARRQDLTTEEVRALLEQLQPAATSADSGAPAANQDMYVEITGPIRRLHVRSLGQRGYVDAMRRHDLIFCIGPAGTGKTYLAVAQALEDLHRRKIKRMVLVRPAVEAGEKLGFLPGDMQAKVNPYLRPLLDALRDMLDFQQVKAYLDNDVIEMAPLAFMRGRTLNDAFIILDEAQNTTVPQMQMLLTRMGAGSKVVVTGDTTQVDLPAGTRNGLRDAVARLESLPEVAVVRMNKSDIVRHSLVQAIVKAYEGAPPRLAEDESRPLHKSRPGSREGDDDVTRSRPGPAGEELIQ